MPTSHTRAETRRKERCMDQEIEAPVHDAEMLYDYDVDEDTMATAAPTQAATVC